MTMPPTVRRGEELSVAWAEELVTSVHEARDSLLIEQAVCTAASGWGRYPGFSDPTVTRIGPLVFLQGMMRNDSGATKTIPQTIVTVPSNFIPRPAGVTVPLGGTVMFANQGSQASTGTTRTQINTLGEVSVVAMNGSSGAIIVANGWVSIQLVWSVL